MDSEDRDKELALDDRIAEGDPEELLCRGCFRPLNTDTKEKVFCARCE